MPGGIQAVAAPDERRISAVIDRRYNSKSQLHSTVKRAPEIRKTKNLRVMLVGEIVDPTKDGCVRINFIFSGKIYEIVILDVEVWSEEILIQFLARVDPFRLDRRSQFLAP